MSQSRPLRSLPVLLTLSGLFGCSMADDPDPLTLLRHEAEASPTPAQAEALARSLLGTAPDRARLRIGEVWADEPRVDALGQAHTRLTQTVDGIPVFGAAAILHTDEHGAVTGLTDGLVHDLEVSTTPRLSAPEAIERAVAATGGGSRLSAEPRAALAILRREGQDHLTYQVDLTQLQPGSTPARPVVFVDAHTGAIAWRYDQLHRWALQHGNRVTHDMHNSTKFAAATVGDSSDAALLQTHDAMHATLKFLAVRVGRDSYDGAGATLEAYGHYDSGYLNAFWDGAAERLVLGDGDGVSFGYFGVTDIVAHEIAHGLVAYEAGLVPAGESGALGETTGDILGAAVSDYVGDSWVFNIGEDCWLPADPTVAFRYLGHPSDDGSSRDHYSDRYTGKGDSGGIHFNSGIGNHFFYLLSEGGQHHDPTFRSGYVVNGLGIEAAFAIWYRALTVYMVPSTDFAGARLATEKAADDLYGPNERQQVATAWFEVGVGGEPL